MLITAHTRYDDLILMMDENSHCLVLHNTVVSL